MRYALRAIRQRPTPTRLLWAYPLNDARAARKVSCPISGPQPRARQLRGLPLKLLHDVLPVSLMHPQALVEYG